MLVYLGTWTLSAPPDAQIVSFNIPVLYTLEKTKIIYISGKKEAGHSFRLSCPGTGKIFLHNCTYLSSKVVLKTLLAIRPSFVPLMCLTVFVIYFCCVKELLYSAGKGNSIYV